MFTRHFFLAVVAVLPLIAALPAASQDEKGADYDPLDRANLDYVPIVTEDGRRAQIETILVQRGNQLLAVQADEGVVQISQNRLRLSGIPVIGDLFARRYSQNDFSSQSQVGAAYLAGDTLLVRLREEEARNFFAQVVIINQMHSYTLEGSLNERYSGLAPPPLPPSPQFVGRAYAGPDGALLVLIEPSVITWSVF